MKAICTPTRDTVYAGFAYDLGNLLQKESDARFYISQGSLLPNLRTLLVKTALTGGASHVLFIDSDMRFPTYALEQLLARGGDIIGANCKQRTQDQWTARRDGVFLSSTGRSDLEKADTIGFGVTLIARAVFEKIPEPWFATPYDGDKFIGEDVFFCEMARKAGFQPVVDHALSQVVKHAGLVEFGV